MGKLLPNTWDPARSRAASDDYNKVMDRTWYCIGGSSAVLAKQDLFWEYNAWKPGEEGRRFTNHTVTRDVGKEIKDFGIWQGHVTKDDLCALRPVVSVLGLRVPSPMALVLNWVSFPADDAHDQFWTYYGNLPFGKRIFFMFALSPHVPEAAYAAELRRLEAENGVEDAGTLFHRLAWSASYKPGDTGEHKVN